MRITTPLHAALLLSLLNACASDDGDGNGDGPSMDTETGMGEEAAPEPWSGGTPHPNARQAWVYMVNETIDERIPTQVTLPETTSDDGRLSNEWVEVYNCLNEDGGFNLGIVQVCHEVQTVVPDEDGNYLSYKPAYGNDNTGEESWPEINMYYHVNRMHDYYRDNHGLTTVDWPIQAVVNLNLKAGPLGAGALSGLGGETGGILEQLTDENGWGPFPNAAYMDTRMLSSFGLQGLGEGRIMFGQVGTLDFAYDATIIYHEYTHAMLRGTALQGFVAGPNGLEDRGFMNEGFADYFAATVTGTPELGKQSIEGANLRTLTERRTCPEGIHTEVHADGKIIGASMWTLRETIGAELADSFIVQATESFTDDITMEGAGRLIIAEAEAHSASVAAEVEAVLDDYGVINCERAKELKPWTRGDDGESLAWSFPGMTTGELYGFTEWTPGFFGFQFEMSAGKQAVEISWTAEPGGGGGILESLLGPADTGPPEVNVDLALKVGSIVEIDYSGEAPAHDADHVVDVPTTDETQVVTLSGACLPEAGERLYMMMMNRGATDLGFQSMDVRYLDSADEGENPVDCL